MKTFTIETETNNIIAHATEREAAAVSNGENFSSAEELAELAANWPAPRLIEIWNSIPGHTPIKKFTDRKTAATRIWKAIQTLGESIPKQQLKPSHCWTEHRNWEQFLRRNRNRRRSSRNLKNPITR